jgi:hypothetical protein
MTEEVNPRWPRRWPVYRFIGLALAIGCGLLFVRLWAKLAAPLEQFYFATYVKGTFLSDFPRVPFHTRGLQSGKTFHVAFLGPYIATDDLLRHPPGSLAIRTVRLNPNGFHIWLQHHVYHGRTLGQTLRWPLGAFGFCVVLLVGAGAYLDHAHNREARNGRRLRGPGLISRWRFNWRTKGDGLGFRIDNWRNPLEWLKPGDSGRYLRMRRDREAHHIQIAGDTGSGKSTLVREILVQVERRGEIGIIFDPDREYIQEFFSEERGVWCSIPRTSAAPIGRSALKRMTRQRRPRLPMACSRTNPRSSDSSLLIRGPSSRTCWPRIGRLSTNSPIGWRIQKRSTNASKEPSTRTLSRRTQLRNARVSSAA